MRSTTLTVALLGLSAALIAAPAQGQSVSGSFTLGGKAYKPTLVAAFRIRDQNAPRTIETFVMLTSKPVDAAAIAADINPYMVAINDPAALNADHIALHITASGATTVNAHIDGTQYLDSSISVMGQPPGLVATCKENTPGRIACSVKTPAAVKPMSGPSWTLDVTFAAAVNSRTPGKPLPPDGGPAAKALLDLITAVGGKTLAPILAGLTPKEAKSYQRDYNSPAENLASAKDILGVRLPKKPKVTGGEMIADNYVVLEVEGTPFEGMENLYLVEMRLVDGKWRYDGSANAGILR